MAGAILADAKKELKQLQRIYRDARAQFRVGGAGSTGQGSGGSDYANLIAPTNECTILVRKVCGLENQCADRGGCGAAMSLLDHFNSSGGDQAAAAAEACVVALGDYTVFPWCTE